MIVKKESFFLIDGFNYIFRSYYGIKERILFKKIPLNIIYGFTSMLLKILSMYNPNKVCILFDLKEKVFRNNIYGKYKSNRKKISNYSIIQIKIINEVLKIFRIFKLNVFGFEADDLIGSMDFKGFKEGMQVIIATSDKDLMQLISKNTIIFFSKNHIQTNKNVFIDKKFLGRALKISSRKIIDIFSFCGDIVDFILGTSFIGMKISIKLTKKYININNIFILCYSKKNNFSLYCNITNGYNNILLSKKLLRINKRLLINEFFCKIKKRSIKKREFINFYKKLKFRFIFKNKWIYNNVIVNQKKE